MSAEAIAGLFRFASQLPCLVGVGTSDFALGGARTLARALESAGAETSLREYPGIEHLLVVQVALPDVFAFFGQ